MYVAGRVGGGKKRGIVAVNSKNSRRVNDLKKPFFLVE